MKRIKCCLAGVAIFVMTCCWSQMVSARFGNETGCFHPDTKILVKHLSSQTYGWVKISDVVKTPKEYGLASPTSREFYKEPLYKDAVIEEIQMGQMPTGIYMVEVTTQGHKRIQMTSHHPVLLSSGEVIKAGALLPQNHFIAFDGSADEVLSVRRQTYTGDVYNLTTSAASHLIFAQGLVVGDLFMQKKTQQQH